MGKILIMGIIGLVAILGAVTYLGAAGTAIMYALGANDSPKETPPCIWHPGNGYGLRFCLCGYLFTEERVGILMQTQDIIRVLQSSDRLQIKKGKTLIYAGYVASMEHTDIEEEILSAEVKRFQAVPEIRHKEWQKRGLMKPLQPEETPEYNFSDLQMSIYHTITI